MRTSPNNITGITDVESLRKAVKMGLRAEYLFFWGHRPMPDGRIGKTCFSQWWPSPFEVDGDLYATAEHFMMAEKARLFGDEETRLKILATDGPANSPAAAKKLGRQVRGFKEHLWLKERFEIVVRGSVAKFSQSDQLLGYLMGTEGRILVEASPKDRIWGIGLAQSDAGSKRPEKWPGLNLLGFALMEARRRLKTRTS